MPRSVRVGLAPAWEQTAWRHLTFLKLVTSSSPLPSAPAAAGFSPIALPGLEGTSGGPLWGGGAERPC